MHEATSCDSPVGVQVYICLVQEPFFIFGAVFTFSVTIWSLYWLMRAACTSRDMPEPNSKGTQVCEGFLRNVGAEFAYDTCAMNLMLAPLRTNAGARKTQTVAVAVGHDFEL